MHFLPFSFCSYSNELYIACKWKDGEIQGRPGDSYQKNEVISASLVLFLDPQYGTRMRERVCERD